MFHGASDDFDNHLSVDPTIDGEAVVRNRQLHERNRVGNKHQLEGHCRPLHARTTCSHWGSNVFLRMAITSFLAVVLQWGMAGPAVVVAWFTHTIGKLE